MATIKARDLWQSAQITSGNDFICTSCKIMTIPAVSRRKLRNTTPMFPLEEIQIDTVPNREPQGISTEFKYNYFLICDIFPGLSDLLVYKINYPRVVLMVLNSIIWVTQ